MTSFPSSRVKNSWAGTNPSTTPFEFGCNLPPPSNSLGPSISDHSYYTLHHMMEVNMAQHGLPLPLFVILEVAIRGRRSLLRIRFGAHDMLVVVEGRVATPCSSYVTLCTWGHETRHHCLLCKIYPFPFDLFSQLITSALFSV